MSPANGIRSFDLFKYKGEDWSLQLGKGVLGHERGNASTWTNEVAIYSKILGAFLFVLLTCMYRCMYIDERMYFGFT